MTVGDRIRGFASDVVHDLKYSLRFQVATFIWLPLIITLGVMMTRFGVYNTMEERLHEWKATFVPESSTMWPDMLITSDFPLLLPQSSCYAQDANGNAIAGQPLVPQMVQSPATLSPNAYQFNFHQTYSQPSAKLVWDTLSGVVCTLVQDVSKGSVTNNTALFVHMPHGFLTVPGTRWSWQPTVVRPNAFVRFELGAEDFKSYSQSWDAITRVWRGRTIYETSMFDDNTNLGPTNPTQSTTIFFHIGFNEVLVHWESVVFDSWHLMAFWGGGFFFFYLLHWIAFSIAKCFIPDDSKVLRGSSASFQPIGGPQ